MCRGTRVEFLLKKCRTLSFTKTLIDYKQRRDLIFETLSVVLLQMVNRGRGPGPRSSSHKWTIKDLYL